MKLHAIFVLCLCLAASAFADARPNFVFFITDDISADDIGPYGNTFVKTPHLDQIAAQGLVFDRAYLTTSSCSPSRSSMITGRYPHNTGAPELHLKLAADQVTFVQLLKAAGYHTLLSGKNHMGDPEMLGFAEVSDGGDHSGSADWVELLQNRPKDRPFFAWFASYDAHRDWQQDAHSPSYDPDAIQVPPYMIDGPETRKDLAKYYSEVSRTDHYAGQVIAELKRQGIAEQTYFIYCADNGRPFPRDKTRLYDSGIQTPLLIWSPGNIQPARSSSLVSVIDFAPTFLELAGIDAGPTFQGVSMVPILKNPRATVRDFAFAEHNWHVFAAHERSVRFGDWLFIRNAFHHKAAMSLESDDSHAPSGQELWEHYRNGRTLPWQEDVMLEPRPDYELFHVGIDPHQFHNLAGQPEFAQIETKLLAVLESWAAATGDTVPAQPTPDRAPGPRPKADVRGELPGAARNATRIDAPGPIRDTGEWIELEH